MHHARTRASDPCAGSSARCPPAKRHLAKPHLRYRLKNGQRVHVRPERNARRMVRPDVCHDAMNGDGVLELRLSAQSANPGIPRFPALSTPFSQPPRLKSANTSALGSHAAPCEALRSTLPSLPAPQAPAGLSLQLGKNEHDLPHIALEIVPASGDHLLRLGIHARDHDSECQANPRYEPHDPEGRVTGVRMQEPPC